jgi:hypothetical protein
VENKRIKFPERSYGERRVHTGLRFTERSEKNVKQKQAVIAEKR